MKPHRLQALRVSLLAIGSVCIALGPLMLLWPAGWRWEPYHARYEQMIVTATSSPMFRFVHRGRGSEHPDTAASHFRTADWG